MDDIFELLRIAKRLQGHTYFDIAELHAIETGRKKALSKTSIINASHGQDGLRELHKWLVGYIEQTRNRYPQPFKDQVNRLQTA